MKKKLKRFENELFEVLDGLLTRMETLENDVPNQHLELLERLQSLEQDKQKPDIHAAFSKILNESFATRAKEYLVSIHENYAHVNADVQPAPPDDTITSEEWAEPPGLPKGAKVLARLYKSGADCDNSCGEAVPVSSNPVSVPVVYKFCQGLGMTETADNYLDDVLNFIREIHKYKTHLQYSLKLADEHIAELEGDPKNTYWVERATAAERSIREYQEGAKRDAQELAAKDASLERLHVTLENRDTACASRIAELNAQNKQANARLDAVDRSNADSVIEMERRIAELTREVEAKDARLEQFIANNDELRQERNAALSHAHAEGYKGDSLSEWAQMILTANKMEKKRGDRYEEAWEAEKARMAKERKTLNDVLTALELPNNTDGTSTPETFAQWTGQLVADKARLDWMGNHSLELNLHTPPGGVELVFWKAERTGRVYAENYREAIDKAAKAEAHPDSYAEMFIDVRKDDPE